MLLPALAMHAIAFNLKRAFHSFLNLTRHPFRVLGVTAARFDMLHAIATQRVSVGQRDLRKILGVTAPTVSRMVRSIERLGYVKRHRHPADRRQILVRLTALGRAIVGRAWRRLSANVDLAFDSALTDGKAWDAAACFHQMSCAETHLWDVRRAFRDKATLHYAWHPDD